MIQTQTFVQQAIVDAASGLMGCPKSLPSWLFYDERGDALFQQIMSLPEYYITKCEEEILEIYKDDICNYLKTPRNKFQLIELGAGDGVKSEIFLRHLLSLNVDVIYHPTDLSGSVLHQLKSRLGKNLPELRVNPINANHFEVFDRLQDNRRKIIFFLGANIGNYTVTEASSFLQHISGNMTEWDLMLIGFDLKKDPTIIEKAYNDSQGVTREFNLNMLTRLNRELGANFNTDEFAHFPYYDPQTGSARSFLVSRKDQTVHIEAINRTIRFTAWETIRTEISQKYDLRMIEKLTSDAGLEIVDIFFDSKNYFADVLLKPVGV